MAAGFDSPTWIVLARDVSDSLEIAGQGRTVVATVLDAATGLIVNVTPATSTDSALKRALKTAVATPAAPLPKTVPGQLVATGELHRQVQVAAATVKNLSGSTVVEAAGGLDEAEEILDGLVGHMEGREQPADPPTVDDWRALYAELVAFARAEPWHRWRDQDWFEARFEIDGAVVERDCLVLGHAGVQRGFNALPDAEDLIRASDSRDDPLAHLDQALIVHLDPARDVRGLYAHKARRYSWPDDLAFVPLVTAVHAGAWADPSASDARLLTLALHAVLAQDGRRLVVAGSDAIVSGELGLADGTTGRFEVARPAGSGP